MTERKDKAMSNMPKLKPCPFCGGEAEIYGGLIDGYGVQCLSCFSSTTEFEGVRGDYEDTAIPKAITAWNTRTPNTEAMEKIKRKRVEQ